MGAKVVETARLQPGRCAITGDTKGPFVDTETSIHRWGRVYLSIRGLRDVLRSEGFLTPEDSEALREDNERLQDEVRRLTAIEEDYQTLVDAVAPHIEVEPKVRETEVTILRDPTDKEIEAWIKREGGNHPAVRAAQPLEKGSPEEWRKIYGDVPPGHPNFVRKGKRTVDAAKVDGGGQVVGTEKTIDLMPDTSIIVIHDQEVDLNKVLEQNVGDVLQWAEGHDESVHEALFHAEYALAKSQDRKPRKGVVEGLGYEYVSQEEYDALQEEDGEQEEEVTTSEEDEEITLEDESDEDESDEDDEDEDEEE